MTSLQTVVMGLVIVLLDIPPDGYDWIADPVGWVLVLLGLAPLAGRLPNQRGLVVAAWVCLLFSVLSWPAGSPATLTPLLGWLFSLPTLAWCFLVCDAVSDAVTGRLRWVALALRAAFAVVAPLPGLVYLAEQNWLSTPAEVLILVANLGLVLVLSSASSRPGLGEPDEPPAAAPTTRDAARPPTEPPAPAPAPARRASTTGFSAAEAKRKARARRDRETPATASGTQSEVRASQPEESGAKTSEAKTSEAKTSQAKTSQAKTSGTGSASSGPPDDTPVTGAEVIEKVRRRRQAREKDQGGAGRSDGPAS